MTEKTYVDEFIANLARLDAELERKNKRIAYLKSLLKQSTCNIGPTLMQELADVAPEILTFPQILKDREMLGLSIFSVCGGEMLNNAIQVSALLRSFDTHTMLRDHLIEALVMQWEIIYYG